MKESEYHNDHLSRYEKLEKLGEGAFGRVYKAKDKVTQQFVAMKEIMEPEDSFGGISTTTLREISILLDLHHPNIIKILDVIYFSENSQLKIYIIFPFIKTDLRRYMEENKGKINLFQIKSILYQILTGIYYLHQNRIFHRDIKPCNILLEENGLIKLADFGLARYFSVFTSKYTIPIQTLHYRAPEVCLGSEFYGPPVDIWGAGCVFTELMESIVLFSGDSEIDEIFKIFNIFGTPTQESSLFKYQYFNIQFPKFEIKDPKSYLKNFDDVCIDLFKKMMKLEPEKRITAKGCLNHEFFDGLDFSHLYKT